MMVARSGLAAMAALILACPDPAGLAESSSRRQSSAVLCASVRCALSPLRHLLHFPHHVQTISPTSFVCFSPSLGAESRDVPGVRDVFFAVGSAVAGREEKLGQVGSLL